MNWQHSKLLLRAIGALALVMGLMLPMLPKATTPVAEAAPPVRNVGAIWTSVENGDRVNANHYASKLDVYLSGGPGAHMKCDASSGLPDGVYYFRVTDPAGKVDLSVLGGDALINRKFTVSGGRMTSYSGTHDTGIPPCGDGVAPDSSPSSITIALADPAHVFADTPNRGGVYKVWASMVGNVKGVSPATEIDPTVGGKWQARYSKIDVFKAPKSGKLTILKDAIPNDAQDFAFTLTSSDPVLNVPFSLDDDSNATLPNQMSFSLAAGSYTVTEAIVAGWDLTNIVCVDPDGGTTDSLASRSATIDMDSGESILCIFTNREEGEPPTGSTITIEKLAFPLPDTSALASYPFGWDLGSFSVSVSPISTGVPAFGSTSFSVAPGTYNVTELLSTTATPSAPWALVEISCIDPTSDTVASIDFTNDANNAAIALGANETVVCTFVNQQSAFVGGGGEVDEIHLTGKKVLDLNPTGSRSTSSPNEPGIPGWVVILCSLDTTLNAGGTTMSDCSWSPGNPGTAVIAVDDADASGNYDLGTWPTSSFPYLVLETTYVDTSDVSAGWSMTFPNDCSDDSWAILEGEVAGVFVDILDADNGACEGTDVIGWKVNFTAVDGDLVDEVEEVSQLDHGNRPQGNGSISGRKFYDNVVIGEENSDPGIGGWKIIRAFLKLEFFEVNFNLLPVAETLTDSNGAYSFSGLFPGTYMLEEVMGLVDANNDNVADPGYMWIQTYPHDDGTPGEPGITLGSPIYATSYCDEDSTGPTGGCDQPYLTLNGTTPVRGDQWFWEVVLKSAPSSALNRSDVDFGNVCIGRGNARSKGYWGNQGLGGGDGAGGQEVLHYTTVGWASILNVLPLYPDLLNWYTFDGLNETSSSADNVLRNELAMYLTGGNPGDAYQPTDNSQNSIAGYRLSQQLAAMVLSMNVPHPSKLDGSMGTVSGSALVFVGTTAEALVNSILGTSDGSLDGFVSVQRLVDAAIKALDGDPTVFTTEGTLTYSVTSAYSPVLSAAQLDILKDALDVANHDNTFLQAAGVCKVVY